MARLIIFRMVAVCCSLSFLLVASLSCANAHYDAINKMAYTKNKFIFLAALVDDYKVTHGSYPSDLESIRQGYDSYVKANPNFQKDFLLVTWKDIDLDMLVTGTGYPIRYLRIGDTDSYYLYGSYGNVAEKPIDQATLEKHRKREIRDSGFYLIVDGEAISGDGLWNIKEKISIANMQSFMQKIDPSRKSFLI